MASRVWVVTNVELGWDCIIGVFSADDLSREELEVRFPRSSAYVVHYGPERVHTDLGEFED